MHCKRCGKSIGTDRGICPFCGAMLTSEQMKIFNQTKKENMYKPELLTEKYGEKQMVYEKRENNDHKLIYILLGLFLFLIIAIIILIFML